MDLLSMIYVRALMVKGREAVIRGQEVGGKGARGRGCPTP